MPSDVLNAPPHVYGALALDRAALRRRDEAWLAARRVDPASRVLVLDGLRLAVSGPEDEPRLASFGVDTHGGLDEEAVFLGLAGESAWFAARGRGETSRGSAAETDAPASRAVELRAVGTLLSAEEAALAAYARAILLWHEDHRYCPRCGGITRPVQGGHARQCTICARDQFPRTDPAVIVLVTDGERCLLGRSPRFPAGMYSTLAGFVEPGESLEATVKREIFEEVGVVVDELVYRSSQPWPFPRSLMLGFRAHAVSTGLQLDPGEIEDALWLDRAALREPGGRPVRLPNADSIARFLIEEWLAEAG